MRSLRNFAVAILVVSALVSCAYAATTACGVTLGGNVLTQNLTANCSVASLTGDNAVSLLNDIGFTVSGPFVFDTSSNTSPSVNYATSESIYLNPGAYEASAYLSAAISDTPASGPGSGYVEDFEVTTYVYDLQVLVASAFAGQTGFDPSFCALPGCTSISSGDTSSTFTVVTGGTYSIQQLFVATLSGVGQGDVITITLPNSSGVGSPAAAPEPGTWGLLAVGMVALPFARRYAMKK
jgi:hypothetical protein